MIIAVTDRKICDARDFREQAEAVISSHPDMMILREKDMPEHEYKKLAKECMRICASNNVKFCVNSFIKVAADIGCGCIQVPFGSLTANSGELKSFEEVWVSVHSVMEAAEAERNGASCLIYGNVFETDCKPGAEGKGMKELKNVCISVDIPVYAIGGINAGNIGAVIDAGCKGACVRGPFMREDPHAVTDGLRRALRERP